jgi:hypothetical protein
MKMSFLGKRFISSALLISLTWILGLWLVDNGWTQDKSGEAVGTNAQAEEALDLLGDLPHPHRMEASALHQLPRREVRTTDPHDPGKEIVYSGIPLMEVLKAGGLLLDSGMAGIRDIVAMTVLVAASDGYRAAFALAELEPEFDRPRHPLGGHQGRPTATTPRGTFPHHRSRRKAPGPLGAPSQCSNSS